MSYHLRRKPGVKENIRVIARDQIEKAISELQDSSLGRHEIVHQVRKRCKKLRGVIRLVRPAFGDYSSENAEFRDAARRLSPVRDARAILECYDRLIDHFAHQVQRDTLRSVREQLAALHDEVVDKDIENESLLDFLHQLRAARGRVDDWQIEGHGFEAVEGGFKKTYRRARSSLSRAATDPSAANLHQWRKRVKYHGYHSRLLRKIWPGIMSERCRALDHLSDLLGDDHDLSALRQSLTESGDRELHRDSVQVVIGLIDRRRGELQAEAWPLGWRLFAEKPKNLVARCGAYWDIWREG